MTDGLGISASTDLVFEENDIANDQVLTMMEDYYGIETYHVVPDPNNTYIDHIDCWGKYLSPTKVLIREVPNSHPQFDEIEEISNYFSNFCYSVIVVRCRFDARFICIYKHCS